MHGPAGLVLTSGSPRRRELLRRLGWRFDVRPADIDETPLPGEDALGHVRRLAAAKAAAVTCGSDAVVLAADTVVELDGELLGKPRDAAHARTMLRRLSGRTHRVHTGVAVLTARGVDVDTETTFVTMCPLSPATVDWYIATGEPLDKAGAYALQGAGGVLIERVRGSVSNVVGLPLTTVAAMLSPPGASAAAS